MNTPARPSVTAPVSRRAEATRLALLRAARDVIARDGYTNARIADIAREAGKSVGVFYNYFKDKTELFAALVDAFQTDLLNLGPNLQSLDAQTAVAVRESVRVFWHTYRKFYPEMLGLYENGLNDPQMLEMWRKIRNAGIKRFAYRIRKQQEAGRCQGLSPELGGSALQSLLEFTCFNWCSSKLDFPKAAIKDELAVEALYQIIARALELEPPSKK